MKKTLVALAVAAVAASAANAEVIYNQDGTKLEVTGSVRLALGKFGNDQRGDLRNDGSRLWVKAQHDLQNGLKALGGLELRFDEGVDDKTKNSFGNPRARQLFAGFAHDDVGTVTFGRQETTLDTVQLSDFAYVWGGNNNLTDYANKSIKFKSAKWNGFSFGADYLFGDSNKNVDTKKGGEKYGYGASVFYSTDLAQDLALNLAAGYGVNRYDDVKTTSTTEKDTSWRTSAQIVYGPAALGVEYGQTVTKVGGEKTETGRNLLVGAQYQVIEPASIYLQWQRNQAKDETVVADNKTTENVYIVGADYKFSKNVITFVEYARASEKTNTYPVEKSKENRYAAGLRVFF
ncbi:porin [Caviibacterium pharyngocola]|uniref:Porin n=1 Tax=Caviibacterium pharyngocola TaxID=28159 RepID=A0A2M8RUJ7_9PAST|nr:porin [Caviibacterium pharyngocola]PJG82568.1 porin [Caviibacterium pharyngocola]